MNYIKHYLNILFILIGIITINACSKEVEILNNNSSEEGGYNGNKPAFKLVVAPINTIKPERAISRSSGFDDNSDDAMQVVYGKDESNNRVVTRGLGEIAEDAEEAIDNIWVLHFNGTNDDAKLISREYITEIGDDYLITPDLSNSSEAEDTEHTIIFIANTNNSSRFTAINQPLSYFKNASQTVSYNSQSELTANGTNLPMSAIYTGKVNSSITEIKLERMVAKVSFRFNVDLPKDHTFEPKAAQVQDCVLQIPFINRDTTNTRSTMRYVDYDMISLNNGMDITWYVPENLKGDTPSIKQPHQKGGNATPKFASNILIYGYYTRPQPDGELESFPVIYRIYIGENSTSDFNVKRNYHYQIGATIANAKSTDKRVTLPNIALYYFAETNLGDINRFVTEKDSLYPLGAVWQWGRNIPFPDSGKGGLTTLANYEHTAFWDSPNKFVKSNEQKSTDTWQSIILRQKHAGAPESYVGNNLDFLNQPSGDPCPKGYHIPNQHEWNAITTSATEKEDDYIKVRNISGSYSAYFSIGTNGAPSYGIKFISKTTNTYTVAYRWKYVEKEGVYITARYLGQVVDRYKSKVSDPSFWEKNTQMDITRFFPYGFYNITLNPSDEKLALLYDCRYWASVSFSDTGATTLYANNNQVLLQFNNKGSLLMPIRCVRN